MDYVDGMFMMQSPVLVATERFSGYFGNGIYSECF
jgi:hypothetical protein